MPANRLWFTVSFAWLVLTLPGDSQPAQMERLLNQVDNSTNWGQVPVSGQAAPAVNPQFGNPALNRPGWLRNIQSDSQPSPPSNPFNLSRRDILRVFLGGSPGSSTGNGSNNANALYGARENLQVAADQAAQAVDAAGRARYDTNSSEKLQAASEAQNHANAAAAAASRATSAAQGGTIDAQDAAAQARNQADRAQEAANQAAANANGGGW